MNDVEAIDILISLYLQLLTSMEKNKIKDLPWKKFEEIMKLANKKLELNEVSWTLLNSLSFKFKVEPES